jgi:DNA invertase Pin-like site-specific DNA recombinase
MRIGLYARVSTDEQESEDEQNDASRVRATSLGYTVVAVESDKISGLDSNRPGFQRIISLAKASEIDAIMVWKVSRFGRDFADAVSNCRDMDRIGVKVLSATEPIEHPFVRAIMFATAEENSRDKSAYVRLKMVSNAASGLWNGKPPVGYLMGPALDPINDKGHKLIRDPAKAPLVTRLFDLASTGRYSLAGLRDQAAMMGLKFAGDKPISRTRIGSILRNPAYTGDVIYGRTPHGRFQVRHHAPETEWAICTDAHPALVTRDQFAAVAAALSKNRAPGFQAGVRGSQYFLTGLVVCGDCGSRMYAGAGGSGRDGKYKFHQYSCVRGSEYGHCNTKSVGGVGVDAYVKEALAGINIGPTERARAAELLRAQEKERHQDADQQRQNLLRDRQRHEDRRLDLARRRFDSDIPADIYAKLESEQVQAIAIIDSALKGLEESRPLDLNAELSWLENWTLDQSDFDLEAWQEFARLFIEKIIIRRPEGKRSSRWHMTLDIQIVWTPAAALLREAATSATATHI